MKKTALLLLGAAVIATSYQCNQPSAQNNGCFEFTVAEVPSRTPNSITAEGSEQEVMNAADLGAERSTGSPPGYVIAQLLT